MQHAAIGAQRGGLAGMTAGMTVARRARGGRQGQGFVQSEVSAAELASNVRTVLEERVFLADLTSFERHQAKQMIQRNPTPCVRKPAAISFTVYSSERLRAPWSSHGFDFLDARRAEVCGGRSVPGGLRAGVCRLCPVRCRALHAVPREPAARLLPL